MQGGILCCARLPRSLGAVYLMVIKTDVIIVGGGLSGLALADRLQVAGVSGRCR